MSISGVVRCKDGCSSLVNITLSSVGSSEAKSVSKRVISLSSNKFSFENVLPGKYTLEVICVTRLDWVVYRQRCISTS